MRRLALLLALVAVVLPLQAQTYDACAPAYNSCIDSCYAKYDTTKGDLGCSGAGCGPCFDRCYDSYCYDAIDWQCVFTFGIYCIY